MNWKIGISAGLVAASISLISASSFATSCTVDSINHLVVDAGDVVPVNIGGLAWATNLSGEPFQVSLTDGDGIAVEYTLEYPLRGITLIKPNDWAEGKTYHLMIDSEGVANDYQPLPAEIATIDMTVSVVGPLLPATVTDFKIIDSAIEKVLDNEASVLDGAWVDVKATVSPSNFYTFNTLVDGEEWISSSRCVTGDPEPGQSAYGFGVDRLTAMCGEFAPEHLFLKPGKHEAQMVVGIMGATETVTTPLLEVDIACETPSEAAPSDDDGCSTTKSSGSLLLLLFGAFFFRRRR